MASWTTLKTKKDYRAALSRIDVLIDKKRNEAMQNEFLLLSYLVEEYEDLHVSIPDVSPAEVIRFMLEMKNIKQQDLVPILGTKGFVSKILNGTAQLPLESIDPLSRWLGISPVALIPKAPVSRRESQRS